jgi:hypothetical protein
MRQIIAILLVAAVGCGGEVSTTGTNDSTKQEFSLAAYKAANAVIVATRPMATSLMTDQVNLVLANNSILSTVVPNLEKQIMSPLTNGQTTNTCPYLTKQGTGATISCRFIVTRAIDESLASSTPLKDDIEQGVDKEHSTTLPTAELKWVKGWVGESVLSGIDVASTHSIDILRQAKVCDQAPTHQESAFTLGEQQGKALLEATDAAVLPTIPRTICNTDTVAATILGEAKKQIDSFISGHAVCDGYKASDLAETVDLSQAEKNRKSGLEEGMRQAYEALRVRLVNSWVCIQPSPPAGDPLVVDLTGDGVKLTDTRVAFDLAATGETVPTPVLGRSNALLAIDLDGNGQIDTGAELFSNASRCGARRCLDGVEALAAYDTNRDGVIDSRDAVYARLRLWQDSNADGRGTAGELRTLAAAGIRSISLDSSLARAWGDAAGNASTRSLTFRGLNGTGTVYDVWYGLQLTSAPRDHRTAGIVSTLSERAR